MGQKKQKPVSLLLESGTIKDIKAAKNKTQKLVQLHWNYYCELAHQRNKISNKLYLVLMQDSASNYEFTSWQRAVKYKYSLHPLSTEGSLQNIGGRFNTGKEVNSEVPIFPALYLAENKDTALQEHLGQVKVSSSSALTARDIALTNPQSETIVSVSGHLDKVFDLSNTKSLNKVVNLMKQFCLSKQLKQMAKDLATEVGVIQTPKELLVSLLMEDWRIWPICDWKVNEPFFNYSIN